MYVVHAGRPKTEEVVMANIEGAAIEALQAPIGGKVSQPGEAAYDPANGFHLNANITPGT
jgi:hypothetical protein